MATCPFCSTYIRGGQMIVTCPNCRTPHHKECWENYQNRCSMLSCQGSGAQPAHVEPRRILANGTLTLPRRQLRVFGLYQVTIPGFEVRLPDWLSRPLPEIRLSPQTREILEAILQGFLGGMVWFLLGYLSLRSAANFVEVPGLAYAVLILLIGFGVWRGLATRGQEANRLVYLAAGWITFWTAGTIIRYIFTLENFRPDSLPFGLTDLKTIPYVFGALGAWVGALGVTYRTGLLRLGFGGLAGLYFQLVLDLFKIPADIRLLVDIGVFIGCLAIPLLWHFCVQEIYAGLAAGFASYWILQLLGYIGIFQQSDGLARLAAGYFLFQPLLGVHLARRRMSLPARFPYRKDNLMARELAPFAVTGLAGVGLMNILLGALIWVGGLFNNLASAAFRAVYLLPLFRDALSDAFPYWDQQLFAQVWAILLLLYAGLAALGQVARHGGWHFAYRLARLSILVSLCAVTGYLIEQNLEVILRTWQLFAGFGSFLLMMDWLLPLAAGVLGVIFALAYAGDQIPFHAILANFILWFVQVLLLSAALAFLGGLLGSGLAYIFRQFAAYPDDHLIWGLSQAEIFPFIGVYLGFLVGFGWFLRLWRRKELGVLTANLRRLLIQVFATIGDWVKIFIEGKGHWAVVNGGFILALLMLVRAWNVLSELF